MEEKLSGLYHPLILEHNRAPQFYAKRPEAQHVLEAHNPLCGDKFTVYLDVENGRIVQATFHGYGCAVSKASASVLIQKIQGQPLETAKEIVASFLAILSDDAGLAVNAPDAETQAFIPAKNFPGRLPCATLAWQTLERFLKLTTHSPITNHHSPTHQLTPQ